MKTTEKLSAKSVDNDIAAITKNAKYFLGIKGLKDEERNDFIDIMVTQICKVKDQQYYG